MIRVEYTNFILPQRALPARMMRERHDTTCVDVGFAVERSETLAGLA